MNKFSFLWLLLVSAHMTVFSQISNDDVLLVSREKDKDFGDIPFKILKIIECIKKNPIKTF